MKLTITSQSKSPVIRMQGINGEYSNLVCERASYEALLFLNAGSSAESFTRKSFTTAQEALDVAMAYMGGSINHTCKIKSVIATSEGFEVEEVWKGSL